MRVVATLIILLPGLAFADVSRLRINEVLPSPASDWDGDTFFDGLDDEFIELYNPSANAIDLAGFWLGDNAGPFQWRIPAGTVIQPNCFLVFNSSDYTTFALSGAGETVTLSDSSGALIDAFTYPNAGADVSWKRLPDGGPILQASVSCPAPGGGVICPNPGSSNNGQVNCGDPTPSPLPSPTPTTSPTPAQRRGLVLNEIMASPASDWDGDGRDESTGDEFIEVYNNSDSPVSLDGHWLGDSGRVLRWQFPDGIIVDPRCHEVVYGGEFNLFSLNGSGDEVYLSDSSQRVLDVFTYTSAASDASWARAVDGVGAWQLTGNCAAPGGLPGCPNPGLANNGVSFCGGTPTPTASPTLTPFPTATPTPTPTPPGPTATFSPTTTPTATPFPAFLTNVELDAAFPASRLHTVDLRVYNLIGAEVDVLLYVALEISGQFFYFPDFTLAPLELADTTLPPGFDTGFFRLWELDLSAPVGAPIELLWYAALISPQDGRLIGQVAADSVTVD